MAKKLGRLAGLAALAGAAYMMREKFGKDKDARGPAATAAEKKLSKDRTDAQKKAVSGPKPVEKSSSAYNPVASSDTRGQAARNRGVGDATNGMDLPKPAQKPAQKPAPVQVNRTAGGDPSQSSGVLRSDIGMTQNEAKKILNQTPADKAQRAAKDRKVIDSNKANSREKRKAYQRNLDAAKVANLKSSKAAIAAAAARKSKTSAAPPAAPSAASPAAPPAAPQKHKMPIVKFFEDLRARGDKDLKERGFNQGGKVKMSSGGMAASRRGDGIAQRGKTKGRMR
jgi:hypothetical protein